MGRGSLVVVAILVALAVSAGRAVSAQLPPAAPAGDGVFYGHIKSLTRSGRLYVLRLDPAWPLEGVSAHDAAVEDLPPTVGVVDGYYARDEGHALLTFLVPASARVTVVTKRPTIASKRVTVGELAQLLKGKNPNHRALLASPAAFGYWVRVASDRVRSLDAQYRP